MIILLSPAKSLDESPLDRDVTATQPHFSKDTAQLARIAKQKSAADLSDLMSISDDLAQLNAKRFKSFRLNGQSNSAKPAILTFNGDVYSGLQAADMSDDDLAFAQEHLRILSGLYGLLTPMDALQPYRLEMGIKLENPRGSTLYDFWGDKIAKRINASAAASESACIVNLASHEYFKAVDKKALNVPLISPRFVEEKNGKSRVISFYAKYARGAMARWMIQNRITKREALSDFNLDGYVFDNEASTAAVPVFSRPQPPAKS
ncbi:peroxide stress protein YaaA [Robiginitomaculum antarcticum]|uniref:peroxide stress protein YaaA n=1 Tax=Robiginitomaculum antarcticum TaxID=437507 RepID=UPI000376374F|nr:peroxide stress protein YaaA [Robiginitomaculum antarcticum]